MWCCRRIFRITLTHHLNNIEMKPKNDKATKISTYFEHVIRNNKYGLQWTGLTSTELFLAAMQKIQ